MSTPLRYASGRISDLSGAAVTHGDRSGFTGPTASLSARLFIGWVLLWLASGCAPLSSPSLKEIANQAGLQPVSLAGGDYLLHSYQREVAGRHALVFIEGDGRPWRAGGRVVSPDPTPARPQALIWMGQTSGPALYLGRPCYGVQAAPGCDPLLWTYGRYSTAVVDSMVLGLGDWLDQHPDIETITLVGYSGGGVLALLLGERDLPVTQVITLSSPVDTDIWSDHHRYGRLFASLNPAAIRLWRADRQRYLYFGANDTQVPPPLFIGSAKQIPHAQLHIVPGVGHQCCAPTIWLPQHTP